MDSRAGNSKTVVFKSSPQSSTTETEIQIPNFPIVKQEDNSQLLPSYFAIINSTGKNGLRMEILDQLQQDLEKLLSTCVVRHVMLRACTESRQKEKWTCVKRKRPEHNLQARKHRIMVLKEKHYPLLKQKAGLPKESRSVIAYKFWRMVDGYCPNITKVDRTFLDDLIKECRKGVNVKIPELGEYYGLEWVQQIIGAEQASSVIKLFKTKTVSRKWLKSTYKATLNNISSEQRSSSASTQGEVNVRNFSKVTENIKPPHQSGSKISANICAELVEENMLKPKDVSSVLTSEDEILREIKKCQLELFSVNEQNIQEINKLRNIILQYENSY